MFNTVQKLFSEEKTINQNHIYFDIAYTLFSVRTGFRFSVTLEQLIHQPTKVRPQGTVEWNSGHRPELRRPDWPGWHQSVPQLLGYQTLLTCKAI